MTHELKCWPQYFERIWLLQKLFEVRRNDRDFQTGDTLRLREWNPEEQRYTNRSIEAKVQYVLHGGQFGIRKGYVVMGIIQDKMIESHADE